MIGWRLAAVLLFWPAVAWGEVLQVSGPDGLILQRPDPGEWCLHWRHSVTGGAVADCFGSEDGRLMLRRSYLHDAAAGLGHIPGRGEMRPDPGGGYWIDHIDEPLAQNRLILRVGQPRVGHELRFDALRVPLSDRVAGQRVEIRLLPDPKDRDQDG